MSLLPAGDGVDFIFFSGRAPEDWISLKRSPVRLPASVGTGTRSHSTNLDWFRLRMGTPGATFGSLRESRRSPRVHFQFYRFLTMGQIETPPSLGFLAGAARRPAPGPARIVIQ